jgi:hypothetical protein
MKIKSLKQEVLGRTNFLLYDLDHVETGASNCWRRCSLCSQPRSYKNRTGIGGEDTDGQTDRKGYLISLLKIRNVV